MFKKIIMTAAICVLFSPALFSDMSSGGGMAGQGMGGGGQSIGGQIDSVGAGAGGGRQGSDVPQFKKQSNTEPAKIDNVSDILTFEEKLNLTSQQVVSIQMIKEDAKQDASDKVKVLLKCREEFDKSLEQLSPDFAYIRQMLKELIDAQISAETAPVDAYERAYSLLNEDQKIKLKFFRAVRQEEIAAKEKAAQDNAQTPPASKGGQAMPHSSGGPTMLGH